jgi:hypothetical protein
MFSLNTQSGSLCAPQSLTGALVGCRLEACWVCQQPGLAADVVYGTDVWCGLAEHWGAGRRQAIAQGLERRQGSSEACTANRGKGACRTACEGGAVEGVAPTCSPSSDDCVAAAGPDVDATCAHV